MTTYAAYQLCAESFSNYAQLKSQGFIDLVLIENINSSCNACPVPQGFINGCTAQGMGSLLNNGNDAGGGGGGANQSYYAGLKKQGLSGAGGESESLDEVNAILANTGSTFVFMNYGGQGTGGPTGNNNIWASQGGHCSYSGGATIGSGQKVSSFIEPYAPGLMSTEEVETEAGYNKDAGCFEVGILIVDWYPGANYAGYADAVISSGATFGGFQFWYVEGDSASGSNNWGPGSSDINNMMKQFPPNTKNIVQRAGGSSPGGGGGGGSGPGSNIPAITGGNTFGGNSEVDILPYLTQNHQGQPTPGVHYVELSSADGIRAQVTASVRVRTWQPKEM